MKRQSDTPWIMRTYPGYSCPQAANELHRINWALDQTDLPIAFDRPTQLGYDPDHPLALGEVGRVGVPVAHLGDLRTLLEGVPLERMHTTFKANATAPWLLALYIALARERGVDPSTLKGTTHNDIFTEYLSGGAFLFPPAQSLRLSGDLGAFVVDSMPLWNPVSICSYQVQEAGASPSQQVAYALAAASALLDNLQHRSLAPALLLQAASKLSFLVGTGVRFVEEICKLRALERLWGRLGRERYGLSDQATLGLRVDVQISSLGLTDRQPENNILRIVYQMLGATLSKRVRARALQTPAWNEASCPPGAWDHQWSLRAQQILALETDLLEHDDWLEGSAVVEQLTDRIVDEAWSELLSIFAQGGLATVVDSGVLKQRLLASQTARLAALKRGEHVVVGVNAFTQTERSPLLRQDTSSASSTDYSRAEKIQIKRLKAWRSNRNPHRVQQALDHLKEAASSGDNLLPPSILAAQAGVTTGEWAQALREVFGDYRTVPVLRVQTNGTQDPELQALQQQIAELTERLGRQPRLLLAKPGLDGHTNALEQLALRAQAAGFAVRYEGPRVTAPQLAQLAQEPAVDLIGLSFSSGIHLEFATELLRCLRRLGLRSLPLVVGGSIPETDTVALLAAGVAQVHNSRNCDLHKALQNMFDLVSRASCLC